MSKRDSKLYKIRRFAQKNATRIMGYEFMAKIYYRIIMKKRCNIDNPTSLSEKICWLKIKEYNNQQIADYADKFGNRDYVADCIGKEYLVPLLGVWNDANDIPFEELPDQYILKCTHGCGYNIIVDDKEIFDEKLAKKKLNKWLKEDFSLYNAEPQYAYIKRRIICEKHIGKDLMDFKFFCFNGKVVYYYISKDLLDNDNAQLIHCLRNGSVAPFQRTSYEILKNYSTSVDIETLIKNAEILARPFPFVRVDFMVSENHAYFSELTFTPGGGYNRYNPEKYDDILGEILRI